MRGAAAGAVGPGLVPLLAELSCTAQRAEAMESAKFTKKKVVSVLLLFVYIYCTKNHDQTGVSNIVQIAGGHGGTEVWVLS